MKDVYKPLLLLAVVMTLMSILVKQFRWNRQQEEREQQVQGAITSLTDSIIKLEDAIQAMQTTESIQQKEINDLQVALGVRHAKAAAQRDISKNYFGGWGECNGAAQDANCHWWGCSEAPAKGLICVDPLTMGNTTGK